MNIDFDLKTLLIVCPMVMLAGFVDSIGGGGGLISLPAYIFAGLPIHSATATNKLSSSMGTTISTIRICKGRKIDFKLIIPAIILTLFGAFLGSKLNLLTDETILKRVLLVILPIIVYFAFKNKDVDNTTKKPSYNIVRIITWLGAFIIGIYDGFYGPGTGTFYMMIFIGLAKMDTIEASAYTKILNLSSNLSSLLTYLISGKCILWLGLISGVCNMIGCYIGSGLVLKNGNKIVRPIIIVVLLLLIIKIIFG